jgi:heme/copper-type cytochrome/quinol oxidase subunit 1
MFNSDTYFVVAHFHIVMGVAMFVCLLVYIIGSPKMSADL